MTDDNTYHVMYLAGAWLVFNGPSVRKATCKQWFATKLEALAFAAFNNQ
jgi:hypothetical protein